jgi:hypothetical protein
LLYRLKQKDPPAVDLLVSVEGLEPSTNGLKGHCSAIELHARFYAGAFYHAHSLTSTPTAPPQTP